MPALPERQPADFAEVLGGPELPLIVGGQAVNVWAHLYATAVPQLDDFVPFVSKDADIYGTRALAETLARRSGWEIIFDARKALVIAAILRKPDAEGAALTVEVLREVNGLTETDLALDTIVEFAAQRYRIPPPPVLLKAKLYNLASLFFTERPQDLKHSRMLCAMVPHYLAELLAESRAGRVDEATFVAAVRYTADVITAGFAGNAARSHGLALDRIVPRPLWLDGPTALQPILARLHAAGLGPP